MDRARARAAGYTDEEIDAEEARRASSVAAPTAAPESPSLLRSVADKSAWVAQQPIDLVRGVGRSVGDVGRGLRQAAAYVAPGLVDPEKARKAQEVAEAESPSTGAFGAGKLAGDIAPWLIGAGAVPKVVSKLPALAAAAKSHPLVSALLGSTAGGAVQAPLSPEAGEYDLPGKVSSGAKWGAAMGPVGYAAGRVFAPFRGKGSEAAQENAAVLEGAGLPHRLPSNITDNQYVQMLSNALEQIPIVGSVLKRKREENLKWGTEKFVESTGAKVDDLTPDTLKALRERASANIDKFRAGPDVPTGDLPPHLQELAARLRNTATVAPTTGTEKKINALREALTPTMSAGKQPRPGIYGTLEEVAQTNPNYRVGSTLEQAAAENVPTGFRGATGTRLFGDIPAADAGIKNTTRSAAEMIDLRNEASAMAAGSGTYLEKKAGRDLQERIEKAIKDTHGDKGAAFDRVLKEYGATKDVTHAGGQFGEFLKEGKLPVNRMVEGSKSYAGMFPERDRLVAAMSGNMPSPPAGWNRALYVSALLGTPLAAGGATKLAGGDATWGTAGASALAASLISGLSRKPPTKEQIEAVRRMITAGGIGADPFN